ncbi:uncharacterized protein FIBRA_05570 [Fibroporia radiculosa]|uniref:Uncharacterized protein n=1 Tax=Fibroporia radiculosa TaxID=599839 RepID=J4HXR8_9APHY|nr:uncharacterized protein FIBRA_05570 [Fibroporia radiculosa]CCM03437.1 predicted protein [Fibroporia radiculosa]
MNWLGSPFHDLLAPTCTPGATLNANRGQRQGRMVTSPRSGAANDVGSTGFGVIGTGVGVNITASAQAVAAA